VFRISNVRNGKHGGNWYVLPGDDHSPIRGENVNLFFDTKRTANAKCRDLNS